MSLVKVNLIHYGHIIFSKVVRITSAQCYKAATGIAIAVSCLMSKGQYYKAF